MPRGFIDYASPLVQLYMQAQQQKQSEEQRQINNEYRERVFQEGMRQFEEENKARIANIDASKAALKSQALSDKLNLLKNYQEGNIDFKEGIAPGWEPSYESKFGLNVPAALAPFQVADIPVYPGDTENVIRPGELPLDRPRRSDIKFEQADRALDIREVLAQNQANRQAQQTESQRLSLELRKEGMENLFEHRKVMQGLAARRVDLAALRAQKVAQGGAGELGGELDALLPDVISGAYDESSFSGKEKTRMMYLAKNYDWEKKYPNNPLFKGQKGANLLGKEFLTDMEGMLGVRDFTNVWTDLRQALIDKNWKAAISLSQKMNGQLPVLRETLKGLGVLSDSDIKLLKDNLNGPIQNLALLLLGDKEWYDIKYNLHKKSVVDRINFKIKPLPRGQAIHLMKEYGLYLK